MNTPLVPCVVLDRVENFSYRCCGSGVGSKIFTTDWPWAFGFRYSGSGLQAVALRVSRFLFASAAFMLALGCVAGLRLRVGCRGAGAGLCCWPAVVMSSVGIARLQQLAGLARNTRHDTGKAKFICE